MMRVVWIVPGFSRDETDWCIPALRDLAREIALRCDLHIVALHYPYRRDIYRVFGATVHSLGGANRGGRHTLSLWRAALRKVDALRPDVVHAFWAYPSGVIAAWLAPKIPAIVHLAGGELIDLPRFHYGLWGKWHIRWWMRWALRRVRVVTAGSRYLIDLAERWIPDREISFAPLGVDRGLFTISAPDRANGPPTVLNVGSLEPIKDQTMLLRAFQRISNALPTARLILVGQGRLENELRDVRRSLGLSDRVEFMGEMPHHNLPALYRSAAICVQSSQHEAQGMAMLEAAACGVPLVGTAVGTVADLSPDAAVAVPVGDEVALAQAMISLLMEPQWQMRLRRAATDVIAREYALTRAVDRAMMMYEMTNEK